MDFWDVPAPMAWNFSELQTAAAQENTAW